MTDFGHISPPQQTRANQTSDTTQADAVNGGSVEQPAASDQPQQDAAPSRQASESVRRSRLQESALAGHARRASLEMNPAQTQNLPPAQFIRQRLDPELTRAGLTGTERQHVRQYLNHLSGAEQTAEVNFLQDRVLNSPNADRAMHTYADLLALRSHSSHNHDRITPEILHTLTQGVSERRTAPNGIEGILGREQAVRAAEVLTTLPPSEYNQVVDLLGRAGNPVGAQGTAQGNTPQVEQALILKSLGARHSEFQDPGGHDIAMADITNFANDIRGLSREELIRRTTTLDVEGRHQLGAFGQVDGHTCVPASAQITRAEADPVYAFWLTNPGNQSNVGDEQRALLRSHDTDHSNAINSPFEHAEVLNSVSGNQTSRVYRPAYIPRESDSGATSAEIRDREQRVVGTVPYVQPGQALDHITELLRDGVDVPITVKPSGQSQQHAMVITDVREGTDHHRRFLIEDPAGGGRTFWVDQSALQARSGTDPGWNPFLGSWVNYFDPAEPGRHGHH